MIPKTSRHRGVAQPGSAPALGAGSRRFKSSRPDQSYQTITGTSCEVPVLFVVGCKWFKWTENRVVLTKILTSLGFIILVFSNIHKALFEGIGLESVTQWEQFIDHVDIKDYNALEFQGYAFGGVSISSTT